MKTIEIYGAIGYEYLYGDLSDALMQANGDDVTLIVNSPGGSVAQGFAMTSATRAYKRRYPNAKITSEIRGVSASMAPIVAGDVSIDIRKAEDNASFMVHNPWNLAMGDYREFEKSTEQLREYSALYARSLANRNTAGKTEADIRAMMDEEKWLYGDQIKAAGFVDEIIPAGSGAETETSAIAMAKTEYQRVVELMRDKKDPEDQRAVAACREIMASLPGLTGSNDIAPSQGGKEDIEVKNLSEFMAQGKEALAEVEALKADAIKAERERVAKLADMRAKFGKVGAIAEMIDAAVADGKAFADISESVLALALAAAESPPPINTGANGTASGESAAGATDGYRPIEVIE